MSPQHPIIVVTGANSGVGFGICHRLLLQLSRTVPTDTLPRKSSNDCSLSRSQTSPFSPAKRLTLVLACRSAARADTARRRLLALIDADILRQKKTSGYDGHAEEFRRGLQIDFLALDLASMDSVFEFAEEAGRRYPYITHLILNAGMVCITGFDWIMVFKQLLTEPVAAFTTPRFLIQRVAAESPDGLGLVWQCNVFGHYSLYRVLEPLLLRNPNFDSRVEWFSSLDAIPEDYNPIDPQLRDAKFSYQASKYQIDLTCTTLARRALNKRVPEGQAHIRHVLVHPGICSTNMTVSVMGWFLELLKHLCFYLARLFGSPNHPIQPYKGATAAVHASLAPAVLLENLAVCVPHKYGSKATLWGAEYVGLDPVLQWEDYAEHGASLIGFCERLFALFAQKRGASSSPTSTDSGVVI